MKFSRLLIALFVAKISFASAGVIDLNRSSITATFKQIGVEVTSKFKVVSGAIDFDPANPVNGKANIAVPLASFDLGDPEYNKEVQKKEWFNAAQFPQATFVSSEIKSAGAGTLLVKGTLTIKGRALDVSVPLVFKRDGKAQVFEGQLSIKRLYFNVGEGEWKDTDTLADDVSIKFKVVTSS